MSDKTSRDERQGMVHAWCEAAFGRAHASSPTQRAVRFLEEAIELYQACGGEREMAHRLVDYICDKLPGQPHQEVGGVGITLLALCHALALSADGCEEAEFRRVLAQPLDYFAGRNEAKNAAGFNTAPPPVTNAEETK